MTVYHLALITLILNLHTRTLAYYCNDTASLSLNIIALFRVYVIERLS